MNTHTYPVETYVADTVATIIAETNADGVVWRAWMDAESGTIELARLPLETPAPEKYGYDLSGQWADMPNLRDAVMDIMDYLMAGRTVTFAIFAEDGADTLVLDVNR